MADNIAVTPGTGKTVLADEVVDGTLGTGIAGFAKIMDGTLDSTNKLVVSAAGAAKVDGSAVTQPISGTVTVSGVATSSNQTNGNQVTKIVDSGGTNQMGIDSTGAVAIQSGGTPGSTAPTRAVQMAGSDGANLRVVRVDSSGNLFANVVATASGGYTPAKLISASSTNATSVKASAGTLGALAATNNGSAPAYVKFYNKASAPTVGTDVPVWTVEIPSNSTAANGAGNNPNIPSEGLNFGTGIALAITGGIADSDTTSVAASQVVVNYGTA